MYESITRKDRNAWLVEFARESPEASMSQIARAHDFEGYGKITRQGVCAALHRELKRREVKK